MQDEAIEVACAHMTAFPNTSLPAMDISFTLEKHTAQSAGLFIRCLLQAWPLLFLCCKLQAGLVLLLCICALVAACQSRHWPRPPACICSSGRACRSGCVHRSWRHQNYGSVAILVDWKANRIDALTDV